MGYYDPPDDEPMLGYGIQVIRNGETEAEAVNYGTWEVSFPDGFIVQVGDVISGAIFMDDGDGLIEARHTIVESDLVHVTELTGKDLASELYGMSGAPDLDKFIEDRT